MIVVPAAVGIAVEAQDGVKSATRVERRRGRRSQSQAVGGNRLPTVEPGMRWCGGYCMRCDLAFRTRKLTDAHSVACSGPMLHGVDMDLRGLGDN